MRVIKVLAWPARGDHTVSSQVVIGGSQTPGARSNSTPLKDKAAASMFFSVDSSDMLQRRAGVGS